MHFVLFCFSLELPLLLEFACLIRLEITEMKLVEKFKLLRIVSNFRTYLGWESRDRRFLNNPSGNNMGIFTDEDK